MTNVTVLFVLMSSYFQIWDWLGFNPENRFSWQSPNNFRPSEESGNILIRKGVHSSCLKYLADQASHISRMLKESILQFLPGSQLSDTLTSSASSRLSTIHSSQDTLLISQHILSTAAGIYIVITVQLHLKCEVIPLQHQLEHKEKNALPKKNFWQKALRESSFQMEAVILWAVCRKTDFCFCLKVLGKLIWKIFTPSVWLNDRKSQSYTAQCKLTPLQIPRKVHDAVTGARHSPLV